MLECLTVHLHSSCSIARDGYCSPPKLGSPPWLVHSSLHIRPGRGHANPPRATSRISWWPSEGILDGDEGATWPCSGGRFILGNLLEVMTVVTQPNYPSTLIQADRITYRSTCTHVPGKLVFGASPVGMERVLRFLRRDIESHFRRVGPLDPENHPRGNPGTGHGGLGHQPRATGRPPNLFGLHRAFARISFGMKGSPRCPRLLVASASTGASAGYASQPFHPRPCRGSWTMNLVPLRPDLALSPSHRTRRLLVDIDPAGSEGAASGRTSSWGRNSRT